MKKKVYQVFVSDLWNNNYLVGFFKDLDAAVPQINNFISEEKWFVKEGDLREYPSTFSTCFDNSLMNIIEGRTEDKEVLDEFYDSEEASLEIRGFILEYNDSLDELLIN